MGRGLRLPLIEFALRLQRTSRCAILAQRSLLRSTPSAASRRGPSMSPLFAEPLPTRWSFATTCKRPTGSTRALSSARAATGMALAGDRLEARELLATVRDEEGANTDARMALATAALAAQDLEFARALAPADDGEPARLLRAELQAASSDDAQVAEAVAALDRLLEVEPPTQGYARKLRSRASWPPLTATPNPARQRRRSYEMSGQHSTPC